MNYTGIEQSKKLIKLGLSENTADMVILHEEPYETSDAKFDGVHQALCVPFKNYNKAWREKYKNISYFPSWSVGALLELLPQSEDFTCNINFAVWEDGLVPRKYELSIEYYPSEEGYDRLIICDDSMVDLLYNGFIWLLENKYITSSFSSLISLR